MGLAELQVVHVTPSIYRKQRPAETPHQTVRVEYPEHEGGGCTMLAVADAAWSMFVVMPLVVGQWRGVWELEQYYTPEHHYERGLWWSMCGGMGFAVLACLLRKPLTRVATAKHIGLPRRLAFVVLSRLYVAVSAAAGVAQWRGTWFLIDMYCGTTYQLALFSIGLGCATLARLKCARNLSGPPFAVLQDFKETMFMFPTRFRTSVSGEIYAGQETTNDDD